MLKLRPPATGELKTRRLAKVKVARDVKVVSAIVPLTFETNGESRGKKARCCSRWAKERMTVGGREGGLKRETKLVEGALYIMKAGLGFQVDLGVSVRSVFEK